MVFGVRRAWTSRGAKLFALIVTWLRHVGVFAGVKPVAWTTPWVAMSGVDVLTAKPHKRLARGKFTPTWIGAEAIELFAPNATTST